MSGIKHLQFDKGSRAEAMIAAVKPLLNKECFIALYLLAFILGQSLGSSYGFYNEFRVLEIALLLGFGVWAWWTHRDTVTRVEGLFFAFVGLASFFWQQPLFIVVDMLLLYLLYKCFFYVTYQSALTRLMVLSSLLIFLMFPVALWDYVSSGVYNSDWYPLPWNIRVYNSYFFIMAILATWLYLNEQRYRYLYGAFLWLAFLAILLDAGCSATLAYSAFVFIVVIMSRSARWRMLSVYGLSWLSYILVSYGALFNTSQSTTELHIARATTSLRYDLWVNAYQCWSSHPVLGCGFYQKYSFEHLAAHPHNVFIQILSETGLLGFGFLSLIVVAIVKNMDWRIRKNYFVIAALIGTAIDMSLSGVYIYPITQVALLWLFVFLLKNPEFEHAPHFNTTVSADKGFVNIPTVVIYFTIAFIFVWVFKLTADTFFKNEIFMTAPRFWIDGYQLF